MDSILKNIFKKGLIIYQDVFLDNGCPCTGETWVKTYIINYEHDLYFIKKVDDQTEVFIPLTNEGKIIV